MAISTFSLPIDIPWQRIAFSQDMIDKTACDRELPLRWRSSIAVFEYQPPEDEQRKDGFIVSYLKVACTITGFQPVGKEIRIRESLGRSGWTNDDLTKQLGEDASKYYACYGAMLEVVVAPHADDDRFTLAEYPYFADFDPKKRELYEVVTETGETMSRSLEDVNVRRGQTTLQSHEIKDKTTISGSLSAQYMGVKAEGSIANESSTTDLNQQGTENIRTTEAAREARETFSHTTQLSQLYHQLNSYHLGTNRAAFFVLPRPHMVQSPATFVNGPREIEGVQEFMLVVVRLKEMEKYCVEAYLETAHLTGAAILDWGKTETQVSLHIHTPDTNRVNGSNSSTRQTGYLIDTDRGGGITPSGPPVHSGKGYKILSESLGGAAGNANYTVSVGTEVVTIDGWAEGLKVNHPEETFPSTLDVNAEVYLKKSVPTISGHQPGLMITARAVCSCSRSILMDKIDIDVSVVFEKILGKSDAQVRPQQSSMSILAANQLGADIKREMLESLSSADRYPRGKVSLLETQLFSEMLGNSIRHANRNVNTRLLDWEGVEQRLAERVTSYVPSITRSQLLEIPLPQQVERFGLSFTEAVKLRRTLMGIKIPEGPPPVPERPRTSVPDLNGLRLEEAQMVITTAKLSFGEVEVMDNHLPKGVVIGQIPQPGTEVHSETEVKLMVSSGLSVRLPDVLNLGLTEALCQLREAGLKSEPIVEGAGRSDTLVRRMEPSPRAWVMPHTKVTLQMG